MICPSLVRTIWCWKGGSSIAIDFLYRVVDMAEAGAGTISLGIGRVGWHRLQQVRQSCCGRPAAKDMANSKGVVDAIGQPSA